MKTLVFVLSIQFLLFVTSCSESKPKSAHIEDITTSNIDTNFVDSIQESIVDVTTEPIIPTTIFPTFAFCVQNQFLVIDTAYTKYTTKGNPFMMNESAIVWPVEDSCIPKEYLLPQGAEVSLITDKGEVVPAIFDSYVLVSVYIGRYMEATNSDEIKGMFYSPENTRFFAMLVQPYERSHEFICAVADTKPVIVKKELTPNLSESTNLVAAIQKSPRYKTIQKGYKKFYSVPSNYEYSGAYKDYDIPKSWWNFAIHDSAQFIYGDWNINFHLAVSEAICGDEAYNASVLGIQIIKNNEIVQTQILSDSSFGIPLFIIDADKNGYPELIFTNYSGNYYKVSLLPDGSFLTEHFYFSMFYCPC